MTHTTVITLPARGVVILASLMPSIALAQGAGPGDATGSVQLSGPTLDEPFHMPTMTDASTLDVVVLEDWHVDTVGGTTRQKLIDIHVDDWWSGEEIRVPVRLIVPLTGTASGFVIGGKGTPAVGDQQLYVSDGTALAIAGSAFGGVESDNDALSQIAELKQELAELKQQDSQDWLTEQRAGEIRGIVQAVLADADTRTTE